MKAQECIDAINSLLEDSVTTVSSEVVAAQYAEQCRQVNDRLSKIAMMLDSGSEIQALQLAEQPPRVLDQALLLSFGDESCWQEYCDTHDHEIAPLIAASTVEKLLDIQGKGLSPNHPLYKEYRAAVMSRDDAKALNLIRVIARMNPGDENAAKELERHRKKALQNALEHLEASMSADDEVLLAAMDRVEECGNADEYRSKSIWKKAVSKRTAIRRNMAWEKMPGLLQSAIDALEVDDWRRAAMHHDEYLGLVANFDQKAEEADELDALSAEVEPKLKKFRAEAQRKADCERLESELIKFADETETLALTPAGVSVEFATSTYEKILQHGKKLKDRSWQLDDAGDKRIKMAASHLKQVVSRYQKRKKMLRVLGCAAIFLVLVALGGAGFVKLKSSERITDLKSMRASDSVEGVRELVELTNGGQKWMLRFSDVAVVVKESEKWLDDLDRRYAVCQQELGRVENQRDSGYAGDEFGDVHTTLQEVGVMVSELPYDMTQEARDRLAILRNDLEKVMSRHQQELASKANDVAEKWGAVLDGIDMAGDYQAAEKSISGASEELAVLHALAENEHPLLQLPPSEASKISDLVAKLEELQSHIDDASGNVKRLPEVESLEEYKALLSLMSVGKFRESELSQLVLDAIPDDARIKAILAFKGDLSAYLALAEVNYLELPKPAAPSQEDIDVIDKLVGSDVLNRLWDVTIRNKSTGREVNRLSLGEMKNKDSLELIWEGGLSEYPTSSVSKLIFKKQELHGGGIVINQKPSEASKLMESLGIDKLMDAQGIGYEESVVTILDLIYRDRDSHPLLKAYVYGQLLKVVKNHEFAVWGLNYSPEFMNDMRVYRELNIAGLLGEMDWLYKSREDESSVRWKKFFDERSGYSITREIRLNQEMAVTVKNKPIRLAGYVGVDGKLEFTNSDSSRIIIGVCKNGDVYEIKVCGIIDKDNQWVGEGAEIMPCSPLITIEVSSDVQKRLLEMNSGGAQP